MSKDEIKSEISRVLDQFSDKALEDLLSFLKSFKSSSSISLLNNDNFGKILSEDEDLLKKLAR